MQTQNQRFEEDVSLREYMNVIIRQRMLILAIFFTSVIIVAAMDYFMPKSYEVSMIIEPSTLGINDSGAFIFVDSPHNIKAKLEAGAFKASVIKALKLDHYIKPIKLNISQPENSTFLKITINASEPDREMSVEILNKYLDELTNFYEDLLSIKKDEIDKRIALISNNIERRDDSIKLNEKNIAIMESREKELINELGITKLNTVQLLEKSDALLEKRVRSDDLSSLLYSNTVQQNIRYFNELNNQISDAKIKKEGVANSIKVLQVDINDLNIEIAKLKSSKSSIRNINLIQAPEVSSAPISGKRMQNIALAGILGLMAGVFLAFFIEFLKR